jgi:hypothetical protein
LSFFVRRVRYEACDACAGKPMLDRSTADALSAAKTEPAAVEFESSVHVDRQCLIAEARAMARDILAEAERAAQDIVASAVKIKAEADRALDEARSKAVCIQKRAQAALALAENIAKSRRMIDTLGG